MWSLYRVMLQIWHVGGVLWLAYSGATGHAGYRCNQFGWLNGLGNMHQKARPQGTCAVLGAGKGRQRNRGQLASPADTEHAHAPEQFVPIHVWHADVTEQDVWPVLLDEGQRIRSRAGS